MHCNHKLLYIKENEEAITKQKRQKLVKKLEHSIFGERSFQKHGSLIELVAMLWLAISYV